MSAERFVSAERLPLTPEQVSDIATYAGVAASRMAAVCDLLERCYYEPAFLRDIERAADLIASSINAGGKVLVCGNGGSAAQAQHFAAELVGRYRLERRALPAIALTTDTSAITAIGNDWSFDQIFLRQLRALRRDGDVLVCLSTSGMSDNVRRAALEMRCVMDDPVDGIAGLVAITGTPRDDRWKIADVHIAIPSTDTALTQELTEHVLHTLAHIVEEKCK